MPMFFVPPELSEEEFVAIYDLISEEAMRMDDDGREGNFDAHKPLASAYRKIMAALRKSGSI